MDILLTIADFLIFGLIAAIPILWLVILKKSTIEFYEIYYFSIGLLLLGLVIYFSAWWSDKSDLMRLEYYGYNMDGMNETERYGKVSQENMERVKSIEIGIMGIGWQLKAIFGFITLIPYILVVYVGDKLLQLIKWIYKAKIRRNTENFKK